MSLTTHLALTASDFQVIEFRRYTTQPGQGEPFSRYFDTFFPEAFQQLGALALGQGLERDHADGFTWLRGFASMAARAMANSVFYYGPVWQEHRNTLNALMVDSDNVYLMRPLHPTRAITVLPAVDPIREPNGAQGRLLAQLFHVKAGQVDAFADAAEASFARYRDAGFREAGVLVTLDAANNFPQLPVRSDGPYLLWLGMAQDNDSAESRWLPLANRESARLAESDLLVAATESFLITPSSRSRLRWLDC